MEELLNKINFLKECIVSAQRRDELKDVDIIRNRYKLKILDTKLILVKNILTSLKDTDIKKLTAIINDVEGELTLLR